MKKCYFTTVALAIMAMLFGGLPAMADGYVTAIPFTETFDDESHYTLGGELPDGWAQYAASGNTGFTRENSQESYEQAHSGQYYIQSYGMSSGRQDVLFTPMLQMTAGSEYTISFYVRASAYQTGRTPSVAITAGQGQTVDDQTVTVKEAEMIENTQFELVEATFTPEESGQYSIAIQVTANLSSSGFVFIDDVTVDGEAVTPPAEEWEASIPYAENFDDAGHYNGQDNLPIGWFTSGESPFFTASSNSIPAVSGAYYMITTSSVIADRRDIAYSPMLEMEAGKPYKVSFYLCMPGESSTPSFKFTAGQEQASDMQTTTLVEVNEIISEWKRYEFTFTPETTGEYCFAFWACSASAGDGYICIDNFRLSEADDVFAPETAFDFGNTLHSIFTGSSIVFPGQAVKLINKTNDAETYEWSVDNGGATISDPAAVNPTITFNEAGAYTVTLRATNSGGTTETSRTLNVSFPAEGESDAFQTVDDALDKIYQQDATPAFREDGSVEDVFTYSTYQDYVVGVNHYYRAFAERFDVLAGNKMDITSITFNSMNYYLFDQTLGIDVDENGNPSEYSSFDKDKQMSIVVYPDKDGRPDVDNPIYKKTDLISNILYLDYKPVRIGVQFDDAKVTVDGPFYIALEFDKLTVDPYSPDFLSRSYFGGDTRKHANGETTLWVKPEAAIPGSEFEQTGTLNQYCRADEFSRELTGYSFCVMPWVTYGKIITTGIGNSTVPGQDITLYVSVDGGSLRLSGLKAGNKVSVYSTGGAAVFTGTAAGEEMTIPASNWGKGIFIVSVDGQSIKVAK